MPEWPGKPRGMLTFARDEVIEEIANMLLELYWQLFHGVFCSRILMPDRRGCLFMTACLLQYSDLQYTGWKVSMSFSRYLIVI